MKNETFCFIDDIRQKKITATGAHHKVVKTGCKLPFEYKTRKELKNLMNSPVISSNPMPYKLFKTLSLEEQQRQLDMWAERYGKSTHILALLLNISQSSASRYTSNKKLDFKGSKSGDNKAKSKMFKQTQLVCDAFYGRAGTPSEEPKAIKFNEPSVSEEPPVYNSDETVPEIPTVTLANPSRFSFSVSGTFTSAETETLLQTLWNASQLNPDGMYYLSVSFAEK